MLTPKVDCYPAGGASSKGSWVLRLQYHELEVLDSLDWFEQSKSQLEPEPEPSSVSEHLEERFVQP
jgi:hypothetical protein